MSRLRRCHHVTDALTTLHWLRLPERVHDFKVADVIEFRVLHGLVSPYLNQFVHVADLPGRRQLRSSTSYQLYVPSFRLSTVGRRSFVRFPSLQPSHGTLSLRMYNLSSNANELLCRRKNHFIAICVIKCNCWQLLAVNNRAYFSVLLMSNCAVVTWKCAVVKVSLCSFKCVKYFEEFAKKQPFTN